MENHPLIDSEHHRRHIEERRLELARNPDERKRVIRAKVHIVHDMLKEAQTVIAQVRLNGEELV